MLSIQGLNTHYGASHILQGVDLELPKGRIAAVLGRNGVGKTTTVKTIMGLVAPSGGSVTLDGTRDVLHERTKVDRLRERLRDDPEVAVEECAGEVLPRLDVRRIGASA